MTASSLSAALNEPLGRPAEPPRVIGVPSPVHQALVGRDADVDEVVRRLTNSDHGAKLALYGRPGVGKSAIALAAVHHLLGEYRWSSVAWMDFEAHSSFDWARPRAGAILDYADATRDVAIAIGDGRALREDPKKRASFLHERLSTGRHLLIADNINEDRHADFIDFLARTPMTVDVIMTLSPKPRWNHAALPVLPLERAAADELFAQLTSSIVSTELREQAGGVPQIMRAVARLHDEGYSDEEIRQQLEQGPSSLAAFQYKTAWEVLSRSKPNRITAAVVFGATAPITVTEVFAISGRLQTRPRTLAALSELRRRQLLVEENGFLTPDRLARAFIQRKLEGTSTMATSRRAELDWLSEKTEEFGGRTRYADIFTGMDELQGHYFDVTRRAATDGLLLEEHHVKAFAGLPYYLFCRGYWTELLRWSTATATARAEHDADQATWDDLNWVPKVLRLQSGLDEARAYLVERLQSLPQSESTGAIAFVAEATLRPRQGVVTADLAKQLQDAAELLNVAGQLRWAVTALLRAGNILREAGSYEKASAVFDRVSTMVGASPESAWSNELLALADASRALIENIRGNWRPALRLLQGRSPQLAQLADTAVVWAEISRAQENLALGRQSRDSYREAKRIADFIGISTDLCESEPGWQPAELRR